MTKKKYKIILPSVVALGVLLGILNAYTTVSARDMAMYTPLVQKIAERFDLDEGEVQSVFNEYRDEHFAEMYAMHEEKLSDAVADGKITEEQKQMILEKHEKMHNLSLETADLDPEARHQRMHEVREESRTWENENDVDMHYSGAKRLRTGFGHGFKAGYMGRM
jgi:hypothetical protein